MHLAVAHGWSVAQPHLVSLRTSGGASATPSATVTGSSDFVASSFPGQVAGQEGPFLRLHSRYKLGNVPVSHFAQTLPMLGMDFSLGAPAVFLFEVLLSHTSYLA